MLHRLLNLFLHHFLFAGTMFFAAGAPAIGAMGSESSGDSGSSATDSGTSGVTDDSGTTDSGLSHGETGERSADEQASDPNTLVDSGDGRKIPQKYTELFKTDKALREMFFSQASLKKEFPGGVREALALKRQVAEVGGLEAVAELQNEITGLKSNSELFAKDQQKWVETSFAENSDASIKAVGLALDFTAEHHPEQYNHIMSKVLLNTLDQYSPVGEIWSLLSGLKDNPGAQQAAQQLAKWYNGIKNTASKIPEKRVDAEAQKLETERQKLTEEKQQIRNQKINSEAVPYMQKSAESQIETKAKTSGIDIQAIKRDTPKRYEKFMADVTQTIHKNVLADKNFVNRFDAALKSGDTAKCVRMLNSRHDLAIKGDGHKDGVVTALVEEWFGPGKKVTPQPEKAQAQTANRGGNSAAVRVPSMPSKTEINWRDPKTRVIDGEAMLHNGKFVKWRD